MKKLVLTTLAACMVVAMNGVYAQPKGVDDANPSGKSPTAEKDRPARKGRTGKDASSAPTTKGADDINPGAGPTAEKERATPRKSRTGSKREVPEAKGTDETRPSGPAPASRTPK